MGKGFVGPVPNACRASTGHTGGKNLFMNYTRFGEISLRCGGQSDCSEVLRDPGAVYGPRIRDMWRLSFSSGILMVARLGYGAAYTGQWLSP